MRTGTQIWKSQSGRFLSVILAVALPLLLIDTATGQYIKRKGFRYTNRIGVIQNRCNFGVVPFINRPVIIAPSPVYYYRPYPTVTLATPPYLRYNGFRGAFDPVPIPQAIDPLGFYSSNTALSSPSQVPIPNAPGFRAPGFSSPPPPEPEVQGNDQEIEEEARNRASEISALGLSERAEQFVIFGDRHFKNGDRGPSRRRYLDALRAAPLAAIPRIRLAQIEIARGDYGNAAELLREAIIAEPDWLEQAGDIQAIYGEPSEFHTMLEDLEAHLQGTPNDRDAWLVLATQLYLSGRTERAKDILVRLNDRRPEASLAALMDVVGIVHR